MSRSVLGWLLLLLAAALLVVEVLAVMARFAAFAGASELVEVRRWQWGDVGRILGAVVCAVVAVRLLRRASNKTEVS